MSKLSKAMDRARSEAGRGSIYFTDPSGEEQFLSPYVDALVDDETPPEHSTTRVSAVPEATLIRNKVFGADHKTWLSGFLKIIRTQVLKRLSETRGSTLLVTSANPREGKTFTSINLAVSLAQEVNKTALLVDADLRNPRVHKTLGIDAKAGLSDYLKGEKGIPELLVNPGIPKLSILPGGNPQAHATELLGSAKMANLVRELKSRYRDRYIVFDSSSLLSCADAQVFAGSVDGILIVVEAERTGRKELMRTLDLLDRSRIVGVVYNKAPGLC